MFAASPPFGDDPVNLVARVQVLAQQADRDLSDGERVAGIDPFVRRRRRVGATAGVADVDVVDREACAARACRRARGAPSSPACAPSKAPRSSMRILPPPPSSAGVPSTVTVEPDVVCHRDSAAPAPTAAAAMMLCPQAWPTPGSASYSAQITMCTGRDPGTADHRGLEAVVADGDLETRRPERFVRHSPRRGAPRRGAPGGRGCRPLRSNRSVGQLVDDVPGARPWRRAAARCRHGRSLDHRHDVAGTDRGAGRRPGSLSRSRPSRR